VEPGGTLHVKGPSRSPRGRPAEPSRAFQARTTEGFPMSILISILITFLVVVLVLYLVNMLPIDGRAKQIVRVIVIIIGVLSLLKYVGVGF
jgi:hypothetical protein